MTDNTGRIVSGIRWLTFGKFASQMISWIITIAVIRLLDPASYGLMAVSMALIGTLCVLGSLGMEELLLLRRATPVDYQREALTLLLSFNLLLMLFAVTIASPYSAFLNIKPAENVIIVLSLLLPITALTILPSCLLERDFRMREIATIEILALVLSSLTSLLLAYLEKGVWALVSAALVNQTVRSIGLIYVSNAPCKPSLSFKRVLGDYHFAGYVTGNRLTWQLTQTVDDVIIGQQLGESHLGAYKVGKNFAFLPLQKVAGIIHQITFPAITSASEQLRPRMVTSGLSLICLATFPVFFGVAAISEPLVEVLFGERWLTTAPILEALALLMPVKAINNFLGTATSASEAPGRRWSAQGLLLAATIIAVSLATNQQEQIKDTALFLMYAHYIVLPLLLLNYLNVLRIRVQEAVRVLLPPWLSACACFVFIKMAELELQDGISEIMVKTLVFGLLYLLLSGLFNRPALKRLLPLFRTRTE
ncbi:oligosaccharide flippase family protein [Motiliproteus sp. SC1-56]|uniref:oligosaccharide flippase family protein n=1 Tax=Motiliproteus sp. SC1-56 TaxID=2799565 RepID=UPI001A8E0448|nr:oligosaccharide flippase family protein [Motiliproteus sp. SC1-56]